MALETEARDPIFKGCTRPALIFGVPAMPFVLSGVAMFIIATLIGNLLVLFLLFPIFFTMKMIVKNDDQKFRLLYLKALFRMRYANLKLWRAYAFNPLDFKKRK